MGTGYRYSLGTKARTPYSCGTSLRQSSGFPTPASTYRKGALHRTGMDPVPAVPMHAPWACALPFPWASALLYPMATLALRRLAPRPRTTPASVLFWLALCCATLSARPVHEVDLTRLSSSPCPVVLTLGTADLPFSYRSVRTNAFTATTGQGVELAGSLVEYASGSGLSVESFSLTRVYGVQLLRLPPSNPQQMVYPPGPSKLVAMDGHPANTQPTLAAANSSSPPPPAPDPASSCFGDLCPATPDRVRSPAGDLVLLGTPSAAWGSRTPTRPDLSTPQSPLNPTSRTPRRSHSPSPEPLSPSTQEACSTPSARSHFAQGPHPPAPVQPQLSGHSPLGTVDQVNPARIGPAPQSTPYHHADIQHPQQATVGLHAQSPAATYSPQAPDPYQQLHTHLVPGLEVQALTNSSPSAHSCVSAQPGHIVPAHPQQPSLAATQPPQQPQPHPYPQPYQHYPLAAGQSAQAAGSFPLSTRPTGPEHTFSFVASKPVRPPFPLHKPSPFSFSSSSPSLVASPQYSPSTASRMHQPVLKQERSSFSPGVLPPWQLARHGGIKRSKPDGNMWKSNDGKKRTKQTTVAARTVDGDAPPYLPSGIGSMPRSILSPVGSKTNLPDTSALFSSATVAPSPALPLPCAPSVDTQGAYNLQDNLPAHSHASPLPREGLTSETIVQSPVSGNLLRNIAAPVPPKSAVKSSPATHLLSHHPPSQSPFNPTLSRNGHLGIHTMPSSSCFLASDTPVAMSSTLGGQVALFRRSTRKKEPKEQKTATKSTRKPRPVPKVKQSRKDSLPQSNAEFAPPINHVPPPVSFVEPEQDLPILLPGSPEPFITEWSFGDLLSSRDGFHMLPGDDSQTSLPGLATTTAPEQ
eukprot:gene570-2469_t